LGKRKRWTGVRLNESLDGSPIALPPERTIALLEKPRNAAMVVACAGDLAAGEKAWAATTRARELCRRAVPLDARQPREPSKRRTTNAQAGAMRSEAQAPRRSERGTQATTEQMNLNSLPPNA
jgi:hypothetical protein